MEKKWSELSPDEKRERRFNRWLSPDDVTFNSPKAERLYRERVTRFIDAIKLKEPDRVPVVFHPGHVPARYSGYTVRDVMYDGEKVIKAWGKYMSDFELDVLPGAGLVRCGRILDILESKMLKWPGHGLPDDCAAQYVEAEYLKANEWEVFQRDPSDFHFRTYLSRIYGAAEPFKKLPPLQSIGGILGGFSAFADPEVQAALEAFRQAGKEEEKWREVISEVDRQGIALGLPPFSKGIVGGGAPLDSIGASLRGTKGTIMDMFQQPETIQRATAVVDVTGVPVVFFPLHRGADGFMSEKQFLTFYWPYLKRVILGCAEEGLVPVLFAEGGYNTRLEIIRDLPKGKVIWHFDQTDMARAKKILGDTACIMGNLPTSLLITGRPDDVKAYCRKLIETAGKGGGYILAPGATADESKVENLKAMLDTAKEYGVYRK
jgi:uroporphyrinogen-III decarboxylase